MYEFEISEAGRYIVTTTGCWGSEEFFHDNEQKGEDQMYLYQVFLVYGLGDVCSPCLPRYVIAKDEDNAILKSKIHGDIDGEWDTDYVTILCLNIGEVKTKPKPKEVKQVE